MKKKLIATVLTISMLGSLAACGKKDEETTRATKSPDATKPKTEATEDTTTAAPTTEETTEPVEEGLTKEKYESMTAEELLEMAEIADLEKITDDEYFWLLETYRFVDIDYDQSEWDRGSRAYQERSPGYQDHPRDEYAGSVVCGKGEGSRCGRHVV
ncbi:MAG: hypothetical protein J5636_11420 [Clostridiales bacterium]|nr:hypothetical protein [Clostridiales bacterium]